MAFIRYVVFLETVSRAEFGNLIAVTFMKLQSKVPSLGNIAAAMHAANTTCSRVMRDMPARYNLRKGRGV